MEEKERTQDMNKGQDKKEFTPNFLKVLRREKAAGTGARAGGRLSVAERLRFCDCRRQVWYQRGYAPGDRNGRQAGYFCSERREAGRGKKTDRQAAGAGGK